MLLYLRMNHRVTSANQTMNLPQHLQVRQNLKVSYRNSSVPGLPVVSLEMWLSIAKFCNSSESSLQQQNVFRGQYRFVLELRALKTQP